MERAPETPAREYVAGQKKYLRWMGGPVRSAFLFAVVLAVVLVPYWWLVVQWSSMFFADSALRFTFITTTFLFVLIIADSAFLIRYYQIVRKREFERQAGELRTSEERYRSLFDNMMEGFAYCQMVYDSDGRPEDFIYLKVNAAFDRITGTKTVTMKRVTEVFPGIKEAFPELFLIYGRVASTGTPESFELDFKPSGKWLHISVYSSEKEYFVAVFEDITDRKKAEEDITRIAREWEVTFNATSDGVCLIDANQNLLRCNTRMAEILGGMKQEDMAGKPCWTVVHKTTGPIPACPFVSAKKSLKRTSVEIPAGDLWFEVTADPVFDSSGTFAGAVHIMRDITERKRAAEALRQANKQLNLLSSITRHDILNQLMALKGYLELSHDILNDTDKLVEYIRKEEQAANTIEHQISFTKDYQELGIAAPAWQNVNASIKKAVAGLPMRDVYVEVDPKDPVIFADPLFEKVFYNLIDNALRYGGAGMKTIRVSSVESGASVTIVCEDDGVGISADDKKKLFTRGFGKNTGLGLFLSREILAITGITITENGEPGKGARFEITVPKGMWRLVGKGA